MTHSKKCNWWVFKAEIGIVLCLGIAWFNVWVGCAAALLLNYAIIKTEPKHERGYKNYDY